MIKRISSVESFLKIGSEEMQAMDDDSKISFTYVHDFAQPPEGASWRYIIPKDLQLRGIVCANDRVLVLLTMDGEEVICPRADQQSGN